MLMVQNNVNSTQQSMGLHGADLSAYCTNQSYIMASQQPVSLSDGSVTVSMAAPRMNTYIPHMPSYYPQAYPTNYTSPMMYPNMIPQPTMMVPAQSPNGPTLTPNSYLASPMSSVSPSMSPIPGFTPMVVTTNPDGTSTMQPLGYSPQPSPVNSPPISSDLIRRGSSSVFSRQSSTASSPDYSRQGSTNSRISRSPSPNPDTNYRVRLDLIEEQLPKVKSILKDSLIEEGGIIRNTHVLIIPCKNTGSLQKVPEFLTEIKKQFKIVRSDAPKSASKGFLVILETENTVEDYKKIIDEVFPAFKTEKFNKCDVHDRTLEARIISLREKVAALEKNVETKPELEQKLKNTKAKLERSLLEEKQSK